MCSIYYKKYSGFVISRVSYKSITECCLISKLLLRPFYPSPTLAALANTQFSTALITP